MKALFNKGIKGLPSLALMAVLMVLASMAAMADTPDTYTLTTTPYAGVVSQTGTFINSMIASYGVPAILIGVAVGGWMFVRRIAKSAFH